MQHEIQAALSADLVIFDLDGTLIDSKKDIAESLNETLVTIGLTPLEQELIYSYVGNGVRPLLERAVQQAGRVDGIDHAIQCFREIYPRRCLETTVMFKTIPEILEYFSTSGKKMAVASNKPFGYVEKILKGLGMERYFLSVKGGDSLPTKKPDPEMLDTILAEADCPRERAVFVGDSAVDIQAGKNSGIRTIGVTYGFRPYDEVVESAPDILIHNPADLKAAIC